MHVADDNSHARTHAHSLACSRWASLDRVQNDEPKLSLWVNDGTQRYDPFDDGKRGEKARCSGFTRDARSKVRVVYRDGIIQVETDGTHALHAPRRCHQAHESQHTCIVLCVIVRVFQLVPDNGRRALPITSSFPRDITLV
jgi:hypothetical protein